VIRQGEVFWFDLGRPKGSEPAKRRPVVVVQSDRFNRSAIQTTVVAAITSNVHLGAAAGNVRLAKGEAGLSRPSVANVSQLRTVEKAALTARLGQLSANRIRELRSGLGLLFEIGE
jgi:mRNA interferase MazF